MGELVERVVPPQGVRPLVAEDLDGLILPNLIVQAHHELMLLPDAFPEQVVGEPRRPNHDGHGGRAQAP